MISAGALASGCSSWLVEETRDLWLPYSEIWSHKLILILINNSPFEFETVRVRQITTTAKTKDFHIIIVASQSETTLEHEVQSLTVQFAATCNSVTKHTKEFLGQWFWKLCNGKLKRKNTEKKNFRSIICSMGQWFWKLYSVYRAKTQPSFSGCRF